MTTYIKLLTPLFLAYALMSCAANPTGERANPGGVNTYDAQLAKDLGADEYGMRSYVLVILKTGPADITDEALRQELFAGHFSNMTSLAERELLVLAGPFIEGGDKRGLFVFNVPTIAQAKELVSTDPAVAAGIFTAEYTRYYGSAALMAINDLHAKIQKSDID